jgi:hypothetical protein
MLAFPESSTDSDLKDSAPSEKSKLWIAAHAFVCPDLDRVSQFWRHKDESGHFVLQ